MSSSHKHTLEYSDDEQPSTSRHTYKPSKTTSPSAASLNKMSASHKHTLEYSDDEQPSTSRHTNKPSKTTSPSAASSKNKRKNKTIAPATVHKYSAYELFGTDSEGDVDDNKPTQEVSKKPRHTPPAVDEPMGKKLKSSSSRHGTTTAGAALEPGVKASARDVFRSDSDDDHFQMAEKPGKKAPKICSYLTKRVPQGVSRQTDVDKDGSHYIELKVYKSSEIKNVQPMNRWRHAIMSIKNQTDVDTEAWTHLTQFIKATRQEFKNCRPEIISGYSNNI